MAKTFHVNMVSADEALFDGEVVRLSATLQTGEIGILAGHTPLLGNLQAGQIRLDFADGSEEVIYVSGGFIEVQPKQTLILADAAERAEFLDEAKIEAAKARAEEAMKNSSATAVDYARAKVELIQAAAQLSALRRSKKY